MELELPEPSQPLMLDLPPPPPPPWLGEEFQCGSCSQIVEEPSEFGDTFYNIVIIIVFSLCMIIILLTLSMLLYRRYKKIYKKKTLQNANVNDFQIESNPKLHYNSKNYNQNYYTNMPTYLLPIYETIEGDYYSDISLSSSSSSTRSHDLRNTNSVPRPHVTEL